MLHKLTNFYSCESTKMSSLSLTISVLLLVVTKATLAQEFAVLANASSPLTLAVQPACGPLDSPNAVEINTGINLSATRYVWHSAHKLRNGDRPKDCGGIR